MRWVRPVLRPIIPDRTNCGPINLNKMAAGNNETFKDQLEKLKSIAQKFEDAISPKIKNGQGALCKSRNPYLSQFLFFFFKSISSALHS